MKRLTTVARYNRSKYATSKLYTGLSAEGKTQSVFAYTAAEAKAELRAKYGFRAVKIARS